jgi:hypothetical protein
MSLWDVVIRIDVTSRGGGDSMGYYMFGWLRPRIFFFFVSVTKHQSLLSVSEVLLVLGVV